MYISVGQILPNISLKNWKTDFFILRNGILSKNEKFCKDNELFKNNIVEAALKLDTDLIKLLLTDNKAKETFFIDIKKRDKNGKVSQISKMIFKLVKMTIS